MVDSILYRLQAIATPLVPNMEKVQIIPPPKDVDPRVLAWKGAAVLGKMDGVADLWITGADWVSSRLCSPSLHHVVPCSLAFHRTHSIFPAVFSFRSAQHAAALPLGLDTGVLEVLGLVSSGHIGFIAYTCTDVAPFPCRNCSGCAPSRSAASTFECTFLGI